MRLQILETGHRPAEKLKLEQWSAAHNGMKPPGTVKTLQYRPEFLGKAFSDLFADVMLGPSKWTEGEREIFATFVSRQNLCPY